MKCRRCLGAVGVAFLLLVLLVLIASSTQARASASPRAAPAASWVVTSTADSGPGSLRQALLDAEDGDIISFDLSVFPPGSPATILLTSGALPQITRNNVTIDASNAGVILDGSNTPAGTSGLVIHGANHVTIKGLHVTGFPDSGIMIRNGATYNTIGGSNATPGGACSGDCNLLSGNGWYGVRIAGMGTMTNTVSGNYIGTDASGTVAQPNGKANGGYGVLIEADASLNVIGGDTVGERNLISGNGDLFCGPPSQAYAIGGGVLMWGGAHDNTVQGNYIGTDASGTAALPNGQDGITVNGDAGAAQILDNVISGNSCNGPPPPRVGVWLAGGGNTVSGNYIGTDASGTAALPNGWAGLWIVGSDNNTVHDNLISGNNEHGLRIGGVGAMTNTVSGNYIGTDASGAAALPNGAGSGGYGVLIDDNASQNIIGGATPTERNVISGNGDLVCGPPDIAYHAGGGLHMGGGAHDNTVQGNYIGTDSSGSFGVPNGSDGITIDDSASGAQILSNVISGNSCDGPPPPRTGLHISGDGNRVEGNYIGTDASGTTAVPNGWAGVWLVGANDNVVRDNLISGNNTQGVYIEQGSNNTIAGNLIGTDASGVNPLSNADHGIQLTVTSQDNTIGGPTLADGNVIAYNAGAGVELRGADSLRNTLSHNSIFGNGAKGIELSDGANLEVFGPILDSVTSDTVSGLAVPDSVVEVFSDDGAQGRTFEGAITADGSGAFSFSQPGGFSLSHVTATATDPEGNTSEFSTPAEPSRDVVAAALYAPQTRHEIDTPLTPLVRVGNGGTVPETFDVTVVITQAGLRVYQDTQTMTDLDPLHYQTLAFSPWTPAALGSHIFQATVQPATPDDDPTNDRMGRAFTVVDSRVDLWSRDNPDDDGQEPSVGAIWQSPDLWVRNQDDGLTEPQDPINNLTNTVYVRVRNRGDIESTNATVTVYWHPPALAMAQSWWHAIGTADVGAVAPGEVYTLSLPWRPQISGLSTEPYHTCLLDVISSTEDLPPDLWDVAGSNNIEQRNVDIISPTVELVLQAASTTVVSTTFSVGNPYAREELVDVLIDASLVPPDSEVRLDLGGLFARWQQVGQDSLTGAMIVSGTTQIALPGKAQAVIGGLPLAAEELAGITLHVKGLSGRWAQIDVSERIDGVILGGSSLQVRGQMIYEVYLPVVVSNLTP